MEELKPCPHCGYPPVTFTQDNYGQTLRIIICGRCDIRTSYDLSDKVVTVWNRRVGE